jgi:hypothetical protein
MPTMPFHLEKGRVLGPLEDLLNASNGPKVTDLKQVYLKLHNGDKLRKALDHLGEDSYPGLTEALGLWFDKDLGYWAQYNPKHAETIATKGIHFAMGRAWGGGLALPDQLPTVRPRPIHLWWFCAQHWFDVWVTQESATSPVNVFFATPPHTLGGMAGNMTQATDDGWAIPAPPKYGHDARDMVLIGATDHEKTPVPPTVVPTRFGNIVIPNPPTWSDVEPIDRWSITLDGGGMH